MVVDRDKVTVTAERLYKKEDEVGHSQKTCYVDSDRPGAGHVRL